MESSFIKLRNTNKLCAKTDLFGVWFGFVCGLFFFFFYKGKVHGFRDTGNYLICLSGTSADRDHLLPRALFVCTFKHKALLCIHRNSYRILF